MAAAAWLLSAQGVLAGPPYVTDDPAPTEHGHWEIYNFAAGSHASGSTSGEGGFDINYGAAPDLQLTVVLPGAYETGSGGTHAGRGTVELAAKYQVLHQADGSWVPDLALFPRAFAPTASERFGSGRWGLLLPVWAQKDFGKWQVFGGAGYDINPGPGNRNFWTGGLAVQRPVSERVALGAEIYHHTRDAVDARPFTGLNLGATWRANEHWSVLASGGPGVQNGGDEGQYSFYLALKADY